MSRDLIFIALALFTWGVGEGMFLSFEPLYLQELGADPVRIGAVLGALGLSMAAAQAPAGYLADRFGRKPVLVAAWYVGVIATWLMALAPSLPLFVTGLLLYGLTAWVMTPLNSYLTAARGKLSVGRAITLISAAFYGGAIIGPLLGGAVGQRLGLRYNFWGAAIFFVVSTMLIVNIRPQPVSSHRTADRSLDIFRDQSYLRYLALVFVVMVGLYLPQSLSPNFLQNQRGLDLPAIGRLVAVSNVGIVVLNLVFGQFATRTGFVLSQAAVAVFALLLWQGETFGWFAGAYFLLGGYRVARNLAIAQVADFVNIGKTGVAYGITETISLLASFVAPPIAGVLYAQNPVWMYTVSLGMIVVTVALSVRFLPRSHLVKPFTKLSEP